jgi:recombination protein RecR
MIDKLPTLAQLIKHLQHVPGMASKHIYRAAHYFLEMDEQRLQQFCTSLLQARTQLAKCPTCFYWKELNSPCIFCSDSRRNQRILCVVSAWHDIWSLERTGSFQGVFHVLGGLICPLEGIGPENLTIEQLLARAQKGYDEIILALNQTPEGEATAAFIARKLEKIPGGAITCLARGVPVGSTLETLDRLTLHKALDERRPF